MTPKQTLLDYYRHQINRHSAPHKGPAAVDYDALNALIDRVSQLLPPIAVKALQAEIEPVAAARIARKQTPAREYQYVTDRLADVDAAA